MLEQKWKAKEKKVHRMTRDGLSEENLATGESRKVGKEESEVLLKRSNPEQSFLIEKDKAGKKPKRHPQPGIEKTEEGSPPEEQEAANSPPKEQNRHGEYRHGSRSSAFSHDHETAMEVWERKARHRKQYQNQRRVKPGKLQFDRMEADGSLRRRIRGNHPKRPRMKERGYSTAGKKQRSP